MLNTIVGTFGNVVLSEQVLRDVTETADSKEGIIAVSSIARKM